MSSYGSGYYGRGFYSSDDEEGAYGVDYYGSGPYGGLSVLAMTLFDTSWDIAYTTDDASDATPSWTTVAAADIRSVDVSRGREDELGRVEAGTAQLVLNNRMRSFDPQVVSGLRPMNRWRIRAVHNAVTYPVFVGYAESYEQSWPATGGRDAITTVRIVDAFKLLALATLPVLSPPTAQTYADVVRFDDPQGYWRFGPEQTSALMEATVGGVSLAPYAGAFSFVDTPIVGDFGDLVGTYTELLARSTTGYIATAQDATTPGLETNGPGDAAGLSAMTIETWFKSSEATPAAARTIASGPPSGGNFQWRMQLETSGGIGFYARNSGGTLYGVVSGLIAANTWYHLVGVVDGTNTRLYANAVSAGSDSWTGVFGTMDAGGYMQLGTDTAVGGTRYYDEVAFYRYGLGTERIQAHKDAGGAGRGFPTQLPNDRIDSVLAAASSPITLDEFVAGWHYMTPTFMHGQPVLDELRNAETAESIDTMLFVNKSGELTFLGSQHRSSAPWNTVQATFDDDGTDTPYLNLAVDYSETFLYNTVTASRIGGTLVTDEDSSSVATYGDRTLTLTDLPITDDADVTAIAASLISKYKDPFSRITSLSSYLTSTPRIAAVLNLDLGYRIRIFRTHPGGGARLDQTAFVQKIQLSSRPGQPITVTLGVSPL